MDYSSALPVVLDIHQKDVGLPHGGRSRCTDNELPSCGSSCDHETEP